MYSFPSQYTPSMSWSRPPNAVLMSDAAYRLQQQGRGGVVDGDRAQLQGKRERRGVVGGAGEGAGKMGWGAGGMRRGVDGGVGRGWWAGCFEGVSRPEKGCSAASSLLCHLPQVPQN